MDIGNREVDGKIKLCDKLFPAPVYRGELEKGEVWSWQPKRHLGLHKPIARLLMYDVEGSAIVTERGCR